MCVLTRSWVQLHPFSLHQFYTSHLPWSPTKDMHLSLITRHSHYPTKDFYMLILMIASLSHIPTHQFLTLTSPNHCNKHYLPLSLNNSHNIHKYGFHKSVRWICYRHTQPIIQVPLPQSNLHQHLLKKPPWFLPWCTQRIQKPTTHISSRPPNNHKGYNLQAH